MAPFAGRLLLKVGSEKANLSLSYSYKGIVKKQSFTAVTSNRPYLGNKAFQAAKEHTG